jgi:hypothetical protein
MSSGYRVGWCGCELNNVKELAEGLPNHPVSRRQTTVGTVPTLDSLVLSGRPLAGGPKIIGWESTCQIG